MASAMPGKMASNQAPSTVEYGGDEIGALVLDPGSVWTRAGFAGEDNPKTVIPTDYGVVENGGEGGKPKYYFGDNEVHAVRPGMEIRNPMSDGIVADWDVATELWRHALTSWLTADLSNHPLLMCEPYWNPPKNREKTIEVAFEDFDVPAFYLAKNGVCSAFAAGKPNAMVVDVGGANVSVSTVMDGFALQKGSARSPIGGEFLSNQVRSYLAQENIELASHYQVLAKSPVDVGAPPAAMRRTFKQGEAPTESYKRFQEERVLTDFKESALQVWTSLQPLPPAATPTQYAYPQYGKGRPFEFPNGYNIVCGEERFRLTEGIFNPPAMYQVPGVPHPDPSTTIGLTSLVSTAMRELDAEIKTVMLGNIVVTGAGSLLYGLNDRLNMELTQQYPGPRVRLYATSNAVERRFASWLGGSILGSLGTFHQLWISKKEYEEHGPNIVEKRCK